jgi:hypothetical protein
MKIGIIGNCQSDSLRRCMAAMSPHSDVDVCSYEHEFEKINYSDLIFIQSQYYNYVAILNKIEKKSPTEFMRWPTFYFPAFHPDLLFEPPMASFDGLYHSAICIAGFQSGLSEAETESLFNEDVFNHLGYFDFWETSKATAIRDIDGCGMDGAALFQSWETLGCFAHMVNHPTLSVASRTAAALLTAGGIDIDVRHPEQFIEDPLQNRVWPVHQIVADRLGCRGSERFVLSTGENIGLSEFVHRSYAFYRDGENGRIRPSRIEANQALYAGLKEFVKRRRRTEYSDLPASSFWRKSVEHVGVSGIDPVVAPTFRLSPQDKIATAGSCFAQHIARVLVEDGRNFLNVEPSKGRDSGDFSARYGNIYTARQLLQLAYRAYGKFVPSDTAWRRDDGRYVDPFRPQMEPDGFASAEETIAATTRHLSAVRRVFQEADVFVFTLGLTECWVSKHDGAVFPLPPGAAGAAIDYSKYAFKNLSVAEVTSDLTEAIEFLRTKNPRLRVIITVSPVPLVATYMNGHVLRSTIYSKSCLRVAAEEVAGSLPFVEYFPSYEIICGSFDESSYFEPDKRSVTQDGVDLVMSILRRHYFEEAPSSITPSGGNPGLSSRSSDTAFMRRERIARLVDAEWYYSAYPDVKVSGLDALDHYRRHGTVELRWPNAIFDPEFYAWQNHFSEAALHNPLEHYLYVGAENGLRPNRLFDPKLYTQRYPNYRDQTPLEDYLARDAALKALKPRQQAKRAPLSARFAQSLASEIQMKAGVLCDEEKLDGNQYLEDLRPSLHGRGRGTR